MRVVPVAESQPFDQRASPPIFVPFCGSG